MAINSSKVDEEQKEVLKSATIRRLFSYLKNYKRQVAVVLVVLAVTIAISTVNPLLLEYAIDVNIAQKDWRGLVALCVFMVVINLVYAAGVRLRMLLMARIRFSLIVSAMRQQKPLMTAKTAMSTRIGMKSCWAWATCAAASIRSWISTAAR